MDVNKALIFFSGFLDLQSIRETMRPQPPSSSFSFNALTDIPIKQLKLQNLAKK